MRPCAANAPAERAAGEDGVMGAAGETEETDEGEAAPELVRCGSEGTVKVKEMGAAAPSEGEA